MSASMSWSASWVTGESSVAPQSTIEIVKRRPFAVAAGRAFHAATSEEWQSPRGLQTLALTPRGGKR